MTPDIKSLIIKDIKNTLDPCVAIPDEELVCLIFKNPHTKRLSKDGLGILKKLYDFHEFEYEEPIRLDMKHMLSLSEKMEFPYYIGKNRFVLFNDADAIMLKLHTNDLRMWLGKNYS